MLQTIVSCKYKTMPLYVVLKNLNLARHSVYGDGSYLYPSIAHQAGFIVKTSCSDKEPFKTSSAQDDERASMCPFRRFVCNAMAGKETT